MYCVQMCPALWGSCKGMIQHFLSEKVNKSLRVCERIFNSFRR